MRDALLVKRLETWKGKKTRSVEQWWGVGGGGEITTPRGWGNT